MMFYEEILRALQKHGVRYLILGGAAVNLHGVPRMTADLDITVDISAQNVEALVEALAESGMKVSLPLDPTGLSDAEQRREWRQEKHLEALTFQSAGSGAPYREVDIVIEPPLDFEEMYEARTWLEIDDIRVDLVSLSHLIEIKSNLGREQDLADVKALKKIDSMESEQDA
ncbi:MAG: nucleotidyltransferase domain-containing protein [Thermoleophilia bacterium]